MNHKVITKAEKTVAKSPEPLSEEQVKRLLEVAWEIDPRYLLRLWGELRPARTRGLGITIKRG